MSVKTVADGGWSIVWEDRGLDECRKVVVDGTLCAEKWREWRRKSWV
jgi:hypothetical protein